MHPDADMRDLPEIIKPERRALHLWQPPRFGRAIRIGIDAHRHHMVIVEAHIDTHQPDETGDEEACANEQNDCETDFRHQERRPEMESASRSRLVAPALSQSVRRSHVRTLQRR